MKHYTWVEKYRPSTLEDVILPKRIKSVMRSHVMNGELPSMILSGPPGVGKTTTVLALLSDMDRDYLKKNASKEGDINTLRTEIAQYAGAVSIMKEGRKYVILDEADGMTSTTQDALKGFIEESSINCGFIFTCNHPNKIIPALRSRLAEVDFTIHPDEAPELCVSFMRRLEFILKENGVEYQKEAVFSLIERYYPDWRRILNEAQNKASTGELTTQNIGLDEGDMDELVSFMKKRDYTSVRRWLGESPIYAHAGVFRKFYDSASDLFDPSVIPLLVVILAKYQHMATFSVDQQINLAGCLAEIMVECPFRE